MKPVWIALTVIAAAGMLYGRKRQKAGAVGGTQLTVICGVLVIVFALANLFSGGNTAARERRKIEAAYQRIAAEKLGSYLASEKDVAKAIVLVAPGRTDSSGTEIQLGGLRKGFGEKAEIVEVITPKISDKKYEKLKKHYLGEDVERPSGNRGTPENKGASSDFRISDLPPQKWYTAQSVDNAVAPYLDRVDVIVSCLGLPQDAATMQTLTESHAPPFALLRGSIHEHKNTIRQGRITAAVTYVPDPQNGKPKRPSKDLDKAFSRRYLLVTSENVEEMADDYESLFQ